MFRLIGLSSLIYMTVFLTIAFFVAVVARRQDEKWLRLFGNAVAAMLCVVAFFIVITGFYAMYATNHAMNQQSKNDRQQIMKGK